MRNIFFSWAATVALEQVSLQLAAARRVAQQDPRRGCCSASGARLDRSSLLAASRCLVEAVTLRCVREVHLCGFVKRVHVRASGL